MVRPNPGGDAMSRRALVTGGAGQDGWYLTQAAAGRARRCALRKPLASLEISHYSCMIGWI